MNKKSKTPKKHKAEMTDQRRKIPRLAPDIDSLEKKITEDLASALELVLEINPKSLLAEQFFRYSMEVFGVDKESDISFNVQISTRILEFIHSALSSFPSTNNRQPTEEDLSKLWNLIENIINNTNKIDLFSPEDGVRTFGGGSSKDVEFWARANWTTIRCDRYPIHEGPFYRLLLTPQSALINEAYGVGHQTLLSGIDDIMSATLQGPIAPIHIIRDIFTEARSTEFKEIFGRSRINHWRKAIPADLLEAVDPPLLSLETADYLNVSKITNWPRDLLSDLTYTRGEVAHYFDKSAKRAGWLTKTLPMRRKPFLYLDNEAFAFDTTFSIESIYRAIQLGIQARVQDGASRWDKAQAQVAENIFTDLFAEQMRGAVIYKSVFYKIPGGGGNYAECDCVILLDDVLLVIEAKAGLVGFVSPDEEPQKFLDRVEKLTLSAYSQAKRFIEYLASPNGGAIYEFRDGKYFKIGVLDLKNFRMILPMAITVDSTTPISSLLKNIPDAGEILGKHPFLIFAIDDLLALTDVLRTGGELLHYLEVRQAIARQKKLMIHDEMDHLGGYISENRVDQIGEENRSMTGVAYFGGSDIIDQYFFGLTNNLLGGKSNPIRPEQSYPALVKEVLNLLDSSRPAGWRDANNLIRNLESKSRAKMEEGLQSIVSGGADGKRGIFHPPGHIHLSVAVSPPIHTWKSDNLQNKCNAVASYYNARRTLLELSVNSSGNLTSACIYFSVDGNLSLDAQKEKKSFIANLEQKIRLANVSRNEKCPCGSGLKYKKCHGR